MKFRQVHLDFHTSPAIENIGEEFDKVQFQKALKTGCINSITCFAKCHHGWSYYDTKVSKRHPNLKFDLLRAQFDAAKEIDIDVPIYLSAGVDNVASYDHPEWREVGPEGQYIGWTKEITKPGFHSICFNSPYLDYLCKQIKEVVKLFPQANGIFLDIVSQGQCCCRWCLEVMAANGIDASIEADRKKCSDIALERYYRETTAVCRSLREDMPVFHNSGHISRGNRDILKYFSHLELESLPTGGWGYDHFPLSAKYCHKLPYDYLGMTGKFHTTWGEFGGYKHPNALKYECASMLAYGAKCSIGDQFQPNGKMDETTYKLIGQAYQEVKAKEPWCEDVENVADIGLLSVAATNSIEQGALYDNVIDTGAARILLEGHFLFDVLDTEMDFSKYKLLILPDEVKVDVKLKAKLEEYLIGGGKLFLTGTSGLDKNTGGFLFDVGATWHGQSEYQPDYTLPHKDIRPSFVDSPLVMYLPSQRIKANSGQSLGQIYDPYFNRTYKHFCSHQHAPHKPKPSGFDCGVRNGSIMYLANPVFSIYCGYGAVACKEYVANSLNSLLGEPTLKVDLPSTARVSLMKQKKHNRYILHLLFTNTINRGGTAQLSNGKTGSIEVIEEILPLYGIQVSVVVSGKIKSVICVPDKSELEFCQVDDHVEFVLPKLQCHQMIELKLV